MNKIFSYSLNVIIYFYLRILNSVIVRIRENIFFYPFNLILPAIKYLFKIKLLKKDISLSDRSKYIISSNLSLPKVVINFGIIESVINENWLINSSDEEISYLPRRLFWVIYELTESKKNNTEFLDNILNDFLIYFLNNVNRKTFPPYILSECISNIALYNRSKNGDWLIRDNLQLKFIFYANESLIKNIEFRGHFSTCNHILNNFRALYFSSHSIFKSNRNNFLICFWEKIIRRIFYPSNILKEGSMHYHLLITRWLFELSICAYEMKDQRMLYLIEPYLKIHMDVLKIFSNKGFIPIFGDLSPDCPIDWILPIIDYSNKDYPYKFIGEGSKGWDRIWNFD